MHVFGSRAAAVTVGAALLAAGTSEAEERIANLLALPGAALERGLAVGGGARAVGPLLDADPATVATLETAEGEPVDYVFAFDDTVSPDMVRLVLADSSGAPPPARIDILVSTTSAQSGFRSLRAEAINPLKPETRLEFRATAAGWIMVRLYPTDGANSLALADLAVSGRQGAPETVYAFSESPAKAIDILDRLATLEGEGFVLDEVERALFEKARTGRLTQLEFEITALLASGVETAAEGQRYLGMLDLLEGEARTSIDTRGDPAEVGAALLHWLHKRVLTGGYRSEQTDLSVLLDEGIFNCVSSAVVYAALGRRLGLDVRAIEVPDHAFAIVYDGPDHMDVETTTARGFDPARERIAEFEALTGFTYIPQANKAKRREIGEAGLAALIFYNHGVALMRDRRYHAALIANFRAMSLDPEFASAAKNALAALGNWSLDLAGQGRWEDALRVAAVGADLAPGDARLTANHVAVWKRWALAEADAGRPEAAVAVLRRAGKVLPDGGFESLQAWIYIRPGEAMAKAGAWEAALSETETGLARLDPGPREELRDWRRGVYLRWANAEIARGVFRAAVIPLERGLAADPSDRRLQRTVAYLGQEWARTEPDLGSALRVLTGLAARFPGVDTLERVTRSAMLSRVGKAAEGGTLESTLALLDGAALPGGLTRDMAEYAYETHGRAAFEGGDWPGAAEIYAAGLAALPDSGLLARNARYVAQEWQREAMASGGPSAVAGVTERLARLFPGYSSVTGAGDAEIERQVVAHVETGGFDAADRLLISARAILSDKTHDRLAHYILDRRAGAAMKDGDWRDAARIYAEARTRLGDTGSIPNNIAYVAQEWTRAAEKAGGAPAVIAVAEELVALFPGNADMAESGVVTIRRAVSRDVRAEAFDAAERLVAAAAPLLEKAELAALVETLYDEQGRSRLKRKDWPGAARAYGDGLAILPDSRRLSGNAAYLVQEWMRAALDEQGAAGFLDAAAAARLALPGLDRIDATAASVLSGRVSDRVKTGEHEAALGLIAAAEPALTGKRQTELRVFVYDRWARSLWEAGDLAGGVEIYDRALRDLPGDPTLTNNRRHVQSKM